MFTIVGKPQQLEPKWLVTSQPQSKAKRHHFILACLLSPHFLHSLAVQDPCLGNGATYPGLGLHTSVNGLSSPQLMLLWTDLHWDSFQVIFRLCQVVDESPSQTAFVLPGSKIMLFYAYTSPPGLKPEPCTCHGSLNACWFSQCYQLFPTCETKDLRQDCGSGQSLGHFVHNNQSNALSCWEMWLDESNQEFMFRWPPGREGMFAEIAIRAWNVL